MRAYKLMTCLVFGLAGLSYSTSSHAHETWLSVEATEKAQRIQLKLKLRTGSNYPESEFGAPASRLLRSAVLTESESLQLFTQASGRTELSLRGASPNQGVSLAVVQLKPAIAELATDEVEAYLRELGDPQAVRARYQQRLASGDKSAWVEQFSKHAKLWIHASPTAPDAAAFKPLGLPLELVPSLDPVTLSAGETMRVCAFAAAKPAGKIFLGLIDHQGKRRTQWSDAQGCGEFPRPNNLAFLLHAISLKALDSGTPQWESHFASLTVVDASLRK